MKIYWSGTSKNIIDPAVKKLRLKHQLTQKELAARLQVQGYVFNDLTILRIEQGKHFVPDYEIIILAEFFDVSPLDLLYSQKK